MKAKQAAKPVGRPRCFDEEQALDRAMNVFWAKGYEGASISDLASAMGLRPASIYAAFGNKESLFGKVLDRYLSGPMAFMRECLDEPTAFAVTECILRKTAEFLTDTADRRGCLMVSGALACGEEGLAVQQLLADRRKAFQAALRQRFERAKVQADLPPESDASDLARLLAAVFQGMTVQAIEGASREELVRVAKLVLSSFPSR